MHRGTKRIWRKCEKYTVKIKCLATLQLVGQFQAAVHFKQNSNHCACGSIFLLWYCTVSYHLSSSKAGPGGFAALGLVESDPIIITFSREIKPMGKLKTRCCRSSEGDQIWPFVLMLLFHIISEQSSSKIKDPISNILTIWMWHSFTYIMKSVRTDFNQHLCVLWPVRIQNINLFFCNFYIHC